MTWTFPVFILCCPLMLFTDKWGSSGLFIRPRLAEPKRGQTLSVTPSSVWFSAPLLAVQLSVQYNNGIVQDIQVTLTLPRLLHYGVHNATFVAPLPTKIIQRTRSTPWGICVYLYKKLHSTCTHQTLTRTCPVLTCASSLHAAWVF